MHSEEEIRAAIEMLDDEIEIFKAERIKHGRDEDYCRYLNGLIAERGFKKQALRWVLGEVQEL